MKNLKGKSDIEMALELYQLNERMKADKKRVDEIKGHFKDKIDGVAKCGAMLITVDFQSREVVNKTQLRKELGKKAEKFINITEYQVLKIRKTS